MFEYVVAIVCMCGVGFCGFVVGMWLLVKFCIELTSLNKRKRYMKVMAKNHCKLCGMELASNDD